jgi:hypothetical protein
MFVSFTVFIQTFTLSSEEFDTNILKYRYYKLNETPYACENSRGLPCTCIFHVK